MARMRLAAALLIAAAVADDCVVEETPVVRIRATHADVAAEVVAAVLADEPIVVESVASAAFLGTLQKATRWTQAPAGVHEALLSVVKDLRLVNGSADVRTRGADHQDWWGCRSGGCRLRDVRDDVELKIDGTCAPAWRLQVAGAATFTAYERTPAERGVSIGDPYVSAKTASTVLQPGDLLVHPGGWRPYSTSGSTRALSGALALERLAERLWSSPARVRARARGPAFPAKRLLEACPDVESYGGFVRAVDDEVCPLPSTPGSGCIRTPAPELLRWPTAHIDVGYHAAPAAYDVDGDGDIDLVIGDAAGRVTYYENTGTSTSPKFELVSSLHAHSAMAVPALADLDGDGLPELAVGGADPAISFFDRNYEPYLETLRLSSEWRNTGPEFLDVDGDGDLDLVIAALGLWDAVGWIKNVGSRTSPKFELLKGGYAHVRKLDLLGLEAPASRLCVGRPAYLDPTNRTWVPQSSIAAGDEIGRVSYLRFIGGADPVLAKTPLFWTAPLQDLDLDALGRAKTFPLPVHEAPAPALADFTGDGVDDLVIGGRYGTLLFFDGARPAPLQWGGRAAPPVPD